jgi:hypothetical protein
MIIIHSLISVRIIVSTALAFAEVYNSNWQGTALGSAFAIIGVVALI